MRFADADNNLVRITRLFRDAGGEVMVLKGRVLDQDGSPVAGARVEIWQCDANGIHLHTRDRSRGGYVEVFQGFGHVVTETDGVYAFRTIVPTVRPGRRPHIHVKAFAAGRELVTMRFAPDPDGPEATVNIVLQEGRQQRGAGSVSRDMQRPEHGPGLLPQTQDRSKPVHCLEGTQLDRAE